MIFIKVRPDGIEIDNACLLDQDTMLVGGAIFAGYHTTLLIQVDHQTDLVGDFSDCPVIRSVFRTMAMICNNLPADLVSVKDEGRTDRPLQISRLPDTLDETTLFSAIADDDLILIMSIDLLSGWVIKGQITYIILRDRLRGIAQDLMRVHLNFRRFATGIEPRASFEILGHLIAKRVVNNEVVASRFGGWVDSSFNQFDGNWRDATATLLGKLVRSFA